VFHYAQIIACSNVHDIRHMRGMSVQMNRDNCLETSAIILDGLFQSSNIHRKCSGVNVNENWSCAAQFDGSGGGDGCVRNRKNCVPGRHIARPQCKVQRICSVGDADRVSDAQVSGELLLERRNLLAKNVPATLKTSSER